MNFYYSEEGKYCTHTVMEKKPFLIRETVLILGFIQAPYLL